MNFTKTRRGNTDRHTFDGYIYKPTSSMSDIVEAMEKMGRKIENARRYKISRGPPFKVSLCVYHKFDNTEKTRSEELKETDLLKVRGKNQLLLRGDNVSRFVRDLVEGYKISKEKGL